jgi:alpha-mannosidase
MDAVVEVPALGIAWVPFAVAKGDKVKIPRQNIVQGQGLRNSHLAVEIDTATGGVRSVLDAARNIPRIGQQLVYAPGSQMICESIEVLRNGVAIGEIRCSGKLVDSHQNTIAEYQQTYRLSVGQRYLELDIDLVPITELHGYPWHAYFASRWAWREPTTRLYKSVHHTKLFSLQTRPETPGFIELESPTGRTAIFSGGLPFWQRHSSRMLDTLLIVEGESEKQFRFALSVDDMLPHQTFLDWLTPPLVVPHQHRPVTGVAAWLYHLDAPSILVLDISKLPGSDESVIVRLFETFGYATEATLFCPRTLKAAVVVNSWGDELQTLSTQGDAVSLRLGCYEFQQVRLDF